MADHTDPDGDSARQVPRERVIEGRKVTKEKVPFPASYDSPASRMILLFALCPQDGQSHRTAPIHPANLVRLAPPPGLTGPIGRTLANRCIDFETRKVAAKGCDEPDVRRVRRRGVVTGRWVHAETAPVAYSKQDFLGNHLDAALWKCDATRHS
jgi:hypothetical protein